MPPPAPTPEEGATHECNWWPIYLEEYPHEQWEYLFQSQKANRRRRCLKLLKQRGAAVTEQAAVRTDAAERKSQNHQEMDGDGGKYGRGEDEKLGGGDYDEDLPPA